MVATRTRMNVWALPPGDQTLHWYAEAIGRMKALPLDDPKGLRWHAAVHGYSGPNRDKFKRPGEKPVNQALVDRYLNKCQHGSAFFLPWHRQYLLLFEETVRFHVRAAGGPADWALPYWDYSERPAPDRYPNDPTDYWRGLPAPFIDPASPLYVSERRPKANKGEPFLSDGDVRLRGAMRAPTRGLFNSFYGPMVKNHFLGFFGALEGSVHNRVHMSFGMAPASFMFLVDGAGMDPIFWLHHANIDRLWEVWKNVDPSHTTPSAERWKKVQFEFRDHSGQNVIMAAPDVEHLASMPYTYQHTAPPSSLAGLSIRQSNPETEVTLGRQRGIKVTELGVVVQVAVVHPIEPERPRTPVPVGQLDKALSLTIEGFKTKDLPYVFEVWLTAVNGETLQPPVEVGALAPFGVLDASAIGASHAGCGVDSVVDLTDAYLNLPATIRSPIVSLTFHFQPVYVPPGAKGTGKIEELRLVVE